MTERFDRLVGGFAFGTPNPIEAQAVANYARNPVPELPASQFHVSGGLLWVNQPGLGRSPFHSQKANFLPRAGIAYAITQSTLLRGGYGIYYDTMGVSNTRAVQTGFFQSTLIQASLDQGQSYIASIANPLPNGLIAPLGPSGGLTTNLGQAITFYDTARQRPYAQRWSFGIQQALPASFLVEGEYVGNKAIHLLVNRELNNTPEQYLSTLPVRDQARIDALSALSPNPFHGLNPVYSTNISRANLLKPYPHFSSVSFFDDAGYSWYHALQARVERRFSRGFTFLLGYTFSKAMEAVQFQNPTAPAPTRSIGTFDRPHRLTMSGIWEIPFGKGRTYGSHLAPPLELLLGGWQLNGIVIRQAGPPLAFGNVLFAGDIDNIALPKGQRSVDRWFNTAAGFNRAAAQQLQFNMRTFPLLLSGVRGDGRSSWDLSAIKNFRIQEKIAIQFRAECYNAWNHANFSTPVTDPVNTAFGQVTSTASDARSWQVSLNVKF